MAWIVGIDEAGYGPNLGPFVMSMVSVRVPDAEADSDLWEVLSDAVCRVGDPDRDRLVIDDSKRVYSTARGLGPLERSLLPITWNSLFDSWPLRAYWRAYASTPFRLLRVEPWYSEVELPLDGPHDSWREARIRLVNACQAANVEFGEFRSVVVFPRQFNALVERHHSKAAVPCWALKRLLRRLTSPPCPALRFSEGGWRESFREQTHVFVDKLGGRNYYQPFLQSVFANRLVMCQCESAASSRYVAPAAAGDLQVIFEPEADRRFLPVALASMLSKYLREVLMKMFNRFWERQLPGLKPTAGYPSDAARFYVDIQPARKRLRIPDEVLWRAR